MKKETLFILFIMCLFLLGCNSSKDLLQIKVNLLEGVSGISLDEGISAQMQVSLPRGYSEICFVDWEIVNNPTEGTILENKVPKTFNNNVFIIPDDIDKRIIENQKNIDRGIDSSPLRKGEFFILLNIKVEDGYKCFNQGDKDDYVMITIANIDGEVHIQ